MSDQVMNQSELDELLASDGLGSDAVEPYHLVGE